MKHKAVFLDKDGTLIENVPYNVDPAKIVLTPRAIEALQLLYQAGYQLFIITNQSGIARGLFPESALVAVEEHVRSLLKAANLPLAGFYYCPHHPDGVVAPYALQCDCRKPQPGLLNQAAQEHEIDLSRSWFVGDILHDIEAGRLAGCRTILLDTGNETEWQLSYKRLPHHTVTDLYAAAQIITTLDRQEPAESKPNGLADKYCTNTTNL